MNIVRTVTKPPSAVIDAAIAVMTVAQLELSISSFPYGRAAIVRTLDYLTIRSALFDPIQIRDRWPSRIRTYDTWIRSPML